MPSRVQNLISRAPKTPLSGSRAATTIELGVANRHADPTNFADTLKRARRSDSEAEPLPKSSKVGSKATQSGKSERENEIDGSSTVESTDETEAAIDTEADFQPVDEDPEAESEGEASQAGGDEDAETESETNAATPDTTNVSVEQTMAVLPAVAPITATVDGAEASIDADNNAIAPGPSIQDIETTVTAQSATAEPSGVTDSGADAGHPAGLMLNAEGQSLESDGDAPADDLPGKQMMSVSANVKPAADAKDQPENAATDDSESGKRPVPTAAELETAPSPSNSGQELPANAEKASPDAIAVKALSALDHETKMEAASAPQPAVRTTAATPAVPPSPAPQPRLQQFAETNHDQIVTSLRTQALAKGGAMEIRLDPPELGALQVSVKMSDGVITASFQTSNDEATRLLSHSLGQLKHALEASGVTVDKLQVQQAPKNDHDGNASDGRNSQHQEDASARQEQQRKEMIKRLWAKLSGAADPLDLVA